jgi:glucosamine--fructose-6-phosphate aminotransferase (isomerizing)
MKEGNSMASPYLQDILDQPEALQRTLDGLKATKPLPDFLSSGKIRRVILTGMGSSFHALHLLHMRLVERGLSTHMVETSELIHYGRALIDPHSLIVAVSQSGKSAEIERLLELARLKSTIIGVTNTPDSPLAEQAAAVVLTWAGAEFSASCKTYLATLAALVWLGDQLSGDPGLVQFPQLAGAPQALSHYLLYWQDYHSFLIDYLSNIRHLFLVGRGLSLAAAGTGALIIKEAAHFHAEGMSSAAFRHGPFEMVEPGVLVMIFKGAAATGELNIRLMQDINTAGGNSELVLTSDNPGPFYLPNGPEIIRPILEILPAQQVSLALAAIKGIEAGCFQRGSKVTVTE